ncbi:MotA/TolQ/ExbB proton channel family protein [Verrucomicrobia bacterium]|jgi:biopolymer transport protein ExbB|nr:MotA/TolQ/ExbB proton channel family protein [Verrucomicrobiota bacterium]MDA7657177.1 MotA/TolQ/ExbB proton channel family protein [Verrucomicrobiota bacterium]
MLEFIQSGGPFMWLLIAASVTSLAMIIERTIGLRWRRVIPRALEEAVERCDSLDDVERLRGACQASGSPLGRLLLRVIERRHWPKAENVDALQTRARKEVAGLERGLVIIEVIVGSAPLLGLVGTLHGLITLFGNFGEASLGNNAVLAKGISIALNTTLTGLLVAIPSLIAWSYFTKKVDSMAIEMETVCDLLLHRFYAPVEPGTDSDQSCSVN